MPIHGEPTRTAPITAAGEVIFADFAGILHRPVVTN
jgi:hypothetical protein